MPAMKSKIFAVIDTNVIVSAFLSSNLESNPVKIFRAIVQERIFPLYVDGLNIDRTPASEFRIIFP